MAIVLCTASGPGLDAAGRARGERQRPTRELPEMERARQ